MTMNIPTRPKLGSPNRFGTAWRWFAAAACIGDNQLIVLEGWFRRVPHAKGTIEVRDLRRKDGVEIVSHQLRFLTTEYRLALHEYLSTQ
jgi:hypothetical protein